MCGIIGCIEEKNVLSDLIDGLSHLEYRGYDSAGIALFSNNHKLQLIKAVGPLKNLKAKVASSSRFAGAIGIGHTRWATHGKATLKNTHPHLSEDQKVILVHNGIIENANEIRSFLIKEGIHFYGETDTEVLTNLIAFKRKDNGGNSLLALRDALLEVRGSYALAILFKDDEERIYVAKKDSPLVVASSLNDDLYVASDMAALPNNASHLYFLENHELAVLTRKKGISFFNMSLKEIKKEARIIAKDDIQEKETISSDFMRKEILEEPLVLERTLLQLSLGLSAYQLTKEEVKKIDSIYLCGCGSAYHVALSASYLFEKIAKIPARAEVASEFRYKDPFLSPNTLFIAISQSGETADTIAALRLAKKKGNKVLGIVNVKESTIALESDYLFLTKAGREVAVATTKAYSAQLLSLTALALLFGEIRGYISKKDMQEATDAFKELPEKAQAIITKEKEIIVLAKEIYHADSLFYIGRLVDYASALEGSLKLKEISYLHSEAYAAGELKHGALALIKKGVPVIALISNEEVKEKTIANLFEAAARGAKVYVITPFISDELVSELDGYFLIPKTNAILYPFLSTIVTQLIAYHVAKLRGCNIDKPRNLAKSVTVE